MTECSIVVATFNRAKVLRTTLDRLCRLPHRPPIIVVDNASRDETQDVLRTYGNRIRNIRMTCNIGAAARTLGAKAASTDLLAFCDDDCWWSADALPKAEERFSRNDDVGVINGCVLVHGTRRDPTCSLMQSTGPRVGDGTAIQFFMAGASVIRRNAYLDAGGYHERYHIGAEESLLSLDLAARGWQLWYCDDVVLYHYPSPINRVPSERRRLALRNRLWTTWLRRSVSAALRATVSYVERAATDRIVRQALVDAIRGLPWVVRERKPIPRELERRIEALAVSVFD